MFGTNTASRMRKFKYSTLAAKSRRHGSRGVALLSVMLVSLCLITLAGVVMRMAVYQTRDRARYEVYKDEFAAAEEALNKSFAHIQFLVTQGTPNFQSEVEAMTPPVVEGYEFPYFAVTQTFNDIETVTQGQWQDLTLHRLRYRIDVTAQKTGSPSDRFSHPGVSLSQNLEITYVPLFNFAVFYDPTMEIAPGPYMEVDGRIHTNGDAYVQSNSGLNFLDRVTVAGNLYHGSHPDSGRSTNNTGDVACTDGSVQETMKRPTGDANADGWLDSRDSDWTAAASDRWNGYVKDSSHGVRALNLPIPVVSDAHAIIDRADPINDTYSLKQERFEYKADLKIIGDDAGTISGYDKDGNPVDLTYPDPLNPAVTKSIVDTSTFYDAREDKWVTSIDVNIANINESAISPANGILYVSNEDQGSNSGVVRLVNGAELPSSAGGFSVASDDPIYVQGDFNTINSTQAMVVADALNILSNAWDDALSNNYSAHHASVTEVNAICIQGIVPSRDGNYSGGVENYFRFLENWSGVEFTFNGSIIQLWESQKAIGLWRYGNPVYEAPIRIWSWDSMLGGMNPPPGTPRVVEITRTQWELGSP